MQPFHEESLVRAVKNINQLNDAKPYSSELLDRLDELHETFHLNYQKKPHRNPAKSAATWNPIPYIATSKCPFSANDSDNLSKNKIYCIKELPYSKSPV